MMYTVNIKLFQWLPLAGPDPDPVARRVLHGPPSERKETCAWWILEGVPYRRYRGPGSLGSWDPSAASGSE